MTAAHNFLGLYFPYHYEVGFAVERTMRDPRLSQLQNVILWTLHAAGDGQHSLPRKQLEATVGPWFEVTSSGFSKALRAMGTKPLALVKLREHPESAREKLVTLSPAGLKAVNAMAQRGEDYIQRIVNELSATEIEEGTRFMRRVSDITNSFGPATAQEQP
ncbi:MAG: MarR family winged helix-turn-helix transcriptional regulator [Pseudomonadales bacterium]